MVRYNYPNDRRNADGAIPVYIVAGPGIPDSSGRLPNIQNNANGAIPINMLAGPPTTPNSGAIPVRIVAGPGTPVNGKFPSDQGQDAGAIPVYNSTASNAMPVWQAGPAPLPPPVVTPSIFTLPTPTANPSVIGTCTATNGPVTWSPGANASPLTVSIAAGSGQLVSMNGATVGPGTYQFNVIATNSSGFGAETITVNYT